MEAGEESDDSSSSSSHSVDQLNDFRERWQQEIEHKTANLRKTKVQKPNVTDDIDENEQKVHLTVFGLYPKRFFLRIL